MQAEEGNKRNGVYVIRNIANGKRYVGSATRTFRQRWRSHLSMLRLGVHGNIRLQRAWNKYGEVSFTFEVCEATLPEHAVACEQTMIDFYQSTSQQHGYNIAPNAGSSRGVTRSKETRAKIAENSRKQFASPEARKQLSIAAKKRYADRPELRQQASERAKVQMGKPEARAAQSARARRMHGTPEARYENAQRTKRQLSSPEARLAHSQRLKAVMSTPEHRKKMSDIRKALNSDPVARASATLKGRLTRATKKLTLLPHDPIQ